MKTAPSAIGRFGASFTSIFSQSHWRSQRCPKRGRRARARRPQSPARLSSVMGSRMAMLPSSHSSDQHIFGFLDLGPSRDFRGHTLARYSSSRHGLRPAISLPALPGGPIPVRAQPIEAPSHRLPPIGKPQRPPSTCFSRDIENFPTLGSITRLQRKNPMAVPVPTIAIADPRQDPIAVYIRRKHKR